MEKKFESVSAIESINPYELIAYEKNPRKHDKGVDELCESIRRHGWTQPILIDQNNRIIAGHGRLLAAKKLNRSKVPCTRIEVTEKEYLEIMLEDNKIAALSRWDKKLHREVMEILQGLDSAIEAIPGYDAEEIDKIFGLATKETIDGTGDFGDAGEVDGEIDPDARVISMTFKLPARNHRKIKGTLGAIQRENELETLSEALIFAMSHFKGEARTIRKTPGEASE